MPALREGIERDAEHAETSAAAEARAGREARTDDDFFDADGSAQQQHADRPGQAAAGTGQRAASRSGA
ncbi:hypothetical protein NFJ02_32g81980 [Pycnococcus provasolii]